MIRRNLLKVLNATLYSSVADFLSYVVLRIETLQVDNECFKTLNLDLLLFIHVPISCPKISSFFLICS